MGVVETLQENKVAVTVVALVVVSLAVLAVGGLVVVPAAVDYLQGAQASAGNVTITEASDESGVAVTIRVAEMRDSEYFNVVVNGGTDEPRAGIELVEPENVTVAPVERIGATDESEPMDGPPDVDVDSVGQEVVVRGLEPGDTIHVIGVRGDNTSSTRILFRSYSV